MRLRWWVLRPDCAYLIGHWRPDFFSSHDPRLSLCSPERVPATPDVAIQSAFALKYPRDPSPPTIPATVCPQIVDTLPPPHVSFFFTEGNGTEMELFIPGASTLSLRPRTTMLIIPKNVAPLPWLRSSSGISN